MPRRSHDGCPLRRDTLPGASFRAAPCPVGTADAKVAAIGQGDARWTLGFEVLNTTLHEEELEASCHAYGCRRERIGP